MRKSEQQKAKIRRQTEAGRKPNKDRTAHEAAREMKLPTLADLSRTPATEEELKQVFDLLETESDRGCALIAGSLLENTLAMTINCHLADCGEQFRKKLYGGSDAPLGTFASKIKMGRALAIYDKRVQKSFETVKDIRNAFAHALRPLDFTNPTIVSHVETLFDREMPKQDENLSPARIRYSAFCFSMGKRLYTAATAQGGKELEISLTI